MATNIDTVLNKLFRWTKVIEYSGVTFYMRVVGDAVLGDARNLGLLESRKLRKSLRDTDSTEYLLYLDSLEDIEDTELCNIITSLAMRDVMREYMQSNPRPVLQSLGDNPTQEEQEEYEAAKEARETQYIEDMTLHVDNWREPFNATLLKRDRIYLLSLARKHVTDQVCEQKFSEVFEEYVVCHSLYTDDKYKVRMFALDQYHDLPADVKSNLREAYNNINIDPDTLKN